MRQFLVSFQFPFDSEPTVVEMVTEGGGVAPGVLLLPGQTFISGHCPIVGDSITFRFSRPTPPHDEYLQWLETGWVVEEGTEEEWDDG